ncbi:hypothetical protein [Caulobacter sp. SSI4214]|uniref:hypothetical protein n=1 Tax=Caulobacter sp. SSI4214 TaxID=2575739 RepID=UPI00143B8C4D|nr:hypothetical protein [Caulobacter sp. SSI4214]
MKSVGMFAALAVGAWIAPTLASAQPSPLVMGRLETYGRFAGDAPFCEAAGYKRLDPSGEAYRQAVDKVADRAGVGAQDAEAAVAAAQARESQEMQAGLDKVKARLADPSGDADLRLFATEVAARCHRVADDPLGSILLEPPPRSRASSVALRYADSLLEPLGRAGWQTPLIKAGAALAEAAGACEAHLGKGAADAAMAPLREPYVVPPDIYDQAFAYFDKRRAAGRAHPETAAQCRGLIAKRAAEFRKIPKLK